MKMNPSWQWSQCPELSAFVSGLSHLCVVVVSGSLLQILSLFSRFRLNTWRSAVPQWPMTSVKRVPLLRCTSWTAEEVSVSLSLFVIVHSLRRVCFLKAHDVKVYRWGQVIADVDNAFILRKTDSWRVSNIWLSLVPARIKTLCY